MTKSKLALFLDTFSISFIISLMCFFWLNRFLKNAILTLIISIFILFALFFVIFRHLLKKYKISKIAFADKKLAEESLLNLKFLTEIEMENFIKNLLALQKIKSNFYKNEKSIFYISLKKPLTENDFFLVHDFLSKSKTTLPLCFICINMDDSFAKIHELSPIKYNIYFGDDLFNIMKEKNLFPLSNSVSQTKLKVIKSKLKKSINKLHFVEFFFSGLSLVFLSMIIPFSKYYLVFGSILLFVSILCLFFKEELKPKTEPTPLSELTKNVTDKQ